MVLISPATTAAGRIFLLGGVLKFGAVSEFISSGIVRVFGVDSSPPHPWGEAMPEAALGTPTPGRNRFPDAPAGGGRDGLGNP